MNTIHYADRLYQDIESIKLDILSLSNQPSDETELEIKELKRDLESLQFKLNHIESLYRLYKRNLRSCEIDESSYEILINISVANIDSLRKLFLEQVVNSNLKSHRYIIEVLNYMSLYI